MRIRLLFFIIGGIAGAVTGLGAGYWRWHEPFDPYARQRWAIVNAADDAATGGALLIGDSIVQRLVMTDLCGLPVFNAGMAGARSDQIAPLAKPLIEKLKPRIIVLSVGTNDRQQGRMPDLGFILPPPPPRSARSDRQDSHKIRLIVIGRDIDMPLQRLSDGVHLNREGRTELKRRLEQSCSGSLDPPAR